MKQFRHSNTNGQGAIREPRGEGRQRLKSAPSAPSAALRTTATPSSAAWASRWPALSSDDVIAGNVGQFDLAELADYKFSDCAQLLFSLVAAVSAPGAHSTAVPRYPYSALDPIRLVSDVDSPDFKPGKQACAGSTRWRWRPAT